MSSPSTNKDPLNQPPASPHPIHSSTADHYNAAASNSQCNGHHASSQTPIHNGATGPSGPWAVNTAVRSALATRRSADPLPAIDVHFDAGPSQTIHEWQGTTQGSASAVLRDPALVREKSVLLEQQQQHGSNGEVYQEPGTLHNKGRPLSGSASTPRLLAVKGSINSKDTLSPGSARKINRLEIDVQSNHKVKVRKQRLGKGQLSPHTHHGHSSPYNSTGSSSSAPSSPVTPGSIRSARSFRSSVRRKAVSSPVRQKVVSSPITDAAAAAAAAAADELAVQQNLKVTCRTMSSYRVVHLLYQSDVELFDAIQEWKSSHPTLWVDDAIDAFAAERGADALAQLVYSTEAFDIILKYDAGHEDLAPIFDFYSHRDQKLHSPQTPPQVVAAQPHHGSSGDSLKEKSSVESSGEISDISAPAPASTVNPMGPDPRISRKRMSLRLSQLRHSPKNLVARAVSLKLLGRPDQSTSQTSAELKRSHSIPHISLPMSTPADESEAALPPLLLLKPLDYSTEASNTVEGSQLSSSSLDNQTAIPNHQLDDATAADISRLQPHSTEQQQSRTPPRKRRKSKKFSKATLRAWKIQLHRRDYQLALLKEGVFFELEKSINSDAIYIKIIAPFWRLAQEAQKTNCKVDLASTILPSIPYASRIFPSITRLMPFLKQPGLEQRREAVLFKVTRLADFHLAEPGRKWSDIVRHAGAIGKEGSHIGAHSGTDGRPGFFQTSRRGYLIHSIMMRTEARNHPYGRKMGLRSALRRGVYQKLYALHDGSFKADSKSIHDLNYRAQLRIKWARRFWTSQPLDLVNTYFGERIGIYFAWLGHYTKWLAVPAGVGVAVFIFGVINAARLKKLDATPNALFAIFDNVLTMPFALFMSIWSTVYIEFWKRANQYYAFRWNMNDYDRVELPRTEFRATKVRLSPVTGKRELYYPLYWKALRMMASSIAVLIAVAVVIASVACLMIFKAWCRHHIGGAYATVVATALLNLIVIIILGEIWCRLAEWLTDKENHKYTDAYEDSLIIKRYLFDFTNMYATLFYYAFFKAPFGGRVFKDRPDLQDACLYDACITELTVQLAVVFIGKQFLNGLFEMVFPWTMRTWNRKKILADQALKRRMLLETRKRSKAPQWAKDDDLPSYEGRILKCYRKTVIQFGFCTLFVTSFPVAPAFALINNWIDIRMEAFRLLTQYRRPIALRAQDIGMWERIMEFVSFTSVITNAAIIAFSSLWIKQNLFVKYINVASEGELLAARLGFILVFEHVVFLFKFILRTAIPNVPLTIKLAVQRSKYMTHIANEGIDTETDEVVELDTDTDTGTDSGSESDDEHSESDGDGSNSMVPVGIGSAGNPGAMPRRHTLDNGAQKITTPYSLQRIWSEAVMKKTKKGSSKSRHRRQSQDTSTFGEVGPPQPTLHEPSPRSRYSSAGQKWEVPLGPAVLQQKPSAVQIGSPRRHHHHHHLDPHHEHQRSQASSSPRRTISQRAPTSMDGDWIVLEESRV